MKKFVFDISLSVIYSFAYSQINTDSLILVLKQAPTDSNSLKNYLTLYHDLDLNEMDAKKIIGEWVITKAAIQDNKQIEATANYYLGIDYLDRSNFVLATQYLTNALKIGEENNLYKTQAQALNDLGGMYMKNKQFEKSIEYRKKSIAISEKYNLLRPAAIAKYNLGGTYLSMGYNNKDTVRLAIKLTMDALKLLKELKDTATIITLSSGISQAYTDSKNYDSAILILNDAGEMIRATGKEQAYVTHYIRIGVIYYEQGKYNDALKYYFLGLPLSQKYEMPQWTYNYYSAIAETYEAMGNYEKANFYNKLYSQVHDSIVNKDNFADAADIQNKYVREKKEKELVKVNANNRQKSTLNKILFGAAAGLIFIGFLGYRNFRTRQKLSEQQQLLQQQKIAELEKDKQLQAVDAMLQGQEEERTRIAKDLHDGLGGMLSGVKLSFVNMKENYVMPPDSYIVFERSLNQLDATISELRKVSHNLMPDALIKFGLKEAINDFCSTLKLASNVDIQFEMLGEDRKLGNTADLFIYRIIQELTNNAIKHGVPSQILVQITENTGKVFITVEDDGKGFTTVSTEPVKGIGLSNIRKRVDYFKGKMDIDSKENEGTSVNIELAI